MNTLIYKTISANAKTANKQWIVMDVKNIPLGRAATVIANLLRGKYKTNYTPHIDCGDNVVVINSAFVTLSGNKWDQKEFVRHTGYPGGIKETTPERLHQKKPEEVLKLAVKRMLPGGALGKKQLSKLKVYVGEKHPHESQSPQLIDVSKLNNKNIVRN